MDTELRDRLPEPLRAIWDRLGELAGLTSSLIPESGDAATLEAVALERSARLREFCSVLEGMDDTTLREDAVRALLADNDSLLEIGEQERSLAADRSAAGVRQRRAITAYGAQDKTA